MQLLQQARCSIKKASNITDVSQPVTMCLCAHFQGGCNSPTKSNVRFRTEGVLFQLPTIPIKNKFQKNRANFVRVLIVLLIVT